MSRDIYISICVPAFNEENSLRQAVEELISTLSGRVKELEVIIVDDGSNDCTLQIAQELAKEYSQVKIIRHNRNLGIGVCYRDALSIAKGEYFTWFPGDGEDSAAVLFQYLPYLDKNTILTCHHRGFDHRPFFRKFLSRLYVRALNKRFRLNLKYYNGLTIFPILALRSAPLNSTGFVILAESLICGIRYGSRVIEFPVSLRKREHGKSKALTFKSFFMTIKDFLRVLLQNKFSLR